MSHSKPNQSAKIRIGHSLNDGELHYTPRRRENVRKCLEKHNIICKMGSIPNIALLGSGGGERAMVALLGSLVQLEKCDLLDCIMYLGGVSGSTWCMASLYNEPNWSTELDAVQKKIIDRLDGPPVSWSDALTKLEEYHTQEDNFSLTHVWAAEFVTTIVKEIDNTTISSQTGNNESNPYPIYTVIDKTCKQTRLNQDAWFEITPHEAGYSLDGAFVDINYFGSQFDNGNIIKQQPTIDMLYLQGLCGSALADGEEILKWFWELIKKLLYGDLISKEHCSGEGKQVLLTLVDLNLCVLKKEDPSDLIRELTRLLEGKVDKQGIAMIISEEKLRLDTLNICENFEDWFGDSDKDLAAFGWNWRIYITIIKRLWYWSWGTTYNLLYNTKVEDVDPSVLSEEKRYYMDAGLLINSPYFPLLRKERNIELIISLDFSAGDPFETVDKTSAMCKELNIPFPVVTTPKNTDPEDFYVFEGENGAPAVIHIPLFNKVNCDGHIKEWAEEYGTFGMPYNRDKIMKLIEKAGENVTNNKDKILEQIRHIIEKKKKNPIGKPGLIV